ncbi:hypothetical protein [Priestia aryabhattai]
MEIKFNRATIKKAIEICKRISDNKLTAKVWLRSFTETDILLYTQRDERGIKYFHHIKTTEPLEAEVSFLANPYELEELLKGKQKEKALLIEDHTDKIIIRDALSKALEVEIQYYTGNFPLEKLPYLSMNDSEKFIDLLEEVTKAASKEVDVIEIGSYDVSLKAPPIYLKRFNLIEDFPQFIFPLDYIQQLSKNIVWPKSNHNNISQCSKGNELYIRVESHNIKRPNENFRQLFVLTEKNTYSPVAKQLDEEIVHTFKINTEELWEVLNEYPASVTDVYLYDRQGDLIVDPYDKSGEPLEETEIEPIFQIEYVGNIKRTKVDRNGLMALLSGYVAEQDIEIIKYVEEEKEIFALRIYDTYLYSIVLAKKEPNYAKVQEKLDKQLEYEKTLTFLNE